MKRTVAVCLIFCALLCGCQKDAGTADLGNDTPIKDEQQNATGGGTAGEDTGGDATRLAYYEQLVSDLQAEILNLKTVIYANRVEYESKLEALQTGNNETAPPPEEEPPSADSESSRQFRYTVTDGKATLTAYVGRDLRVTVPSEIDGYPVTAIGDRCFFENITLTEVSIPTSVTEIGWFAFSGCVALKAVEMPVSVTSISYGAFENCDAQMTVICPSGSYAERYAQSYGLAVKRT